MLAFLALLAPLSSNPRLKQLPVTWFVALLIQDDPDARQPKAHNPKSKQFTIGDYFVASSATCKHPISNSASKRREQSGFLSDMVIPYGQVRISAQPKS